MRKASLIPILLALSSYLPQILSACSWSEWNKPNDIFCLWYQNVCRTHSSRSCNCSDNLSDCGSVEQSIRVDRFRCRQENCPHIMKYSEWETSGDWTGPCPTKKRKLIRKCSFHALQNNETTLEHCTGDEAKYEGDLRCSLVEVILYVILPCIISFIGLALIVVFSRKLFAHNQTKQIDSGELTDIVTTDGKKKKTISVYSRNSLPLKDRPCSSVKNSRNLGNKRCSGTLETSLGGDADTSTQEMGNTYEDMTPAKSKVPSVNKSQDDEGGVYEDLTAKGETPSIDKFQDGEVYDSMPTGNWSKSVSKTGDVDADKEKADNSKNNLPDITDVELEEDVYDNAADQYPTNNFPSEDVYDNV